MEKPGRVVLTVTMGIVILTTTVSCYAGAEPTGRAELAQAFRAHGEPVTPAADGTIFCEAEEFQIQKPGWRAGVWGENYYAATLANTFLSRKAFLGAPGDCDETTATINVEVKEAGRYLVLARYEDPYRFNCEFRIKVEQGGQVVLDRLYGAKKNLKIWAFSTKLKAEEVWTWGPVENIVWEGHDAYADLQPGPAKITLVAGRQPAPRGKRNVDVIMLTTDEAQVKKRIAKEQYLPLDGWLTQTGDVWMRITNAGAEPVQVKSFQFSGGPMQQHSPFWVHMRNWKPISVDVPVGVTTDWIEVGSTMDTLNDGQWGFESSGPCKLEFGVRNAAGEIEKIRQFDADGKLPLISFADVRYSRLIRTHDEALAELMEYLKSITVHGRPPSKMYVIASSSIIDELKPLYGFNGHYMSTATGYKDWRAKSAAQIDAMAKALSTEEKKDLLVMSLGDEIALPEPEGDAATEGFVAFLKAQGVKPSQLNHAAGDDWAKIVYNPDAGAKATQPGQYYWSMRYLHHYGIAAMKQCTDVLLRHFPNVHVGANYSPHHRGYRHGYLGEVFQWVSCFRRGGMTMPWSEDYIWQLPVGTQQMNGINLDLFRAGLRHQPKAKIHYYVMAHMPGNTPAAWRRLYHNALAHGMKMMNLFGFDPVWATYTENHVTGNEMYGMVLKTLYELGLYDDIAVDGQRRSAEVALWFSETADIWDDNHHSFAAAKRAMYVAVLGSGHALDFVVDDDALDGTLNAYKVLYLTDNHVSNAASAKIAEWVQNGGQLFATAGAGMFDEYDKPNRVMRKLLGVEQVELVAPQEAHVTYIKQDMPFAQPLTEVALKGSGVKFGVYGLLSKVKVVDDAKVQGTFADGSAAVVSRIVGKGGTTYCAFLPSLSYFKPAIPLKPVDRGSTDEAMSHFIPTAFDKGAAKFIAAPMSGLTRPIETSASLIETAVIESEQGTIIVLQNWSGKAVKAMKLTVNIPVPTNDVSLAGETKVTTKRQGDRTIFTFDMDISGDVLVLR